MTDHFIKASFRVSASMAVGAADRDRAQRIEELTVQRLITAICGGDEPSQMQRIKADPIARAIYRGVMAFPDAYNSSVAEVDGSG
jgi:hypothetical protein